MKTLLRCACLVAVAACYPTTTRPAFVALPMSSTYEFELAPGEAIQELALALDADSIPVSRTETKDAWLETPWFDAATLRPTPRRPLGDGIVRIHAWAEPSKANFSTVTVETVFRPYDDPSRESRSLERLVPANHAVAIRVVRVLNALQTRFGEKVEAPDTTATPAPANTKLRPKPGLP